ncbi:MAG: CDP-glycerol glycerophosphotransferase family protein [Myxococcota bacterium]
MLNPNRRETCPMGLIRELREWFRFAYRTPEAEKDIVFFSESTSYWAYFEGLVEGLKAQSTTPFCYVTADPSDPILNTNDPQIRPFYLNQLLPFFMQFVKCKAFVMTLTELDLHHIKRSVNPVHYVYTFHSLNSTHMAYQARAFEHYDSLLCCGPYMVKELERDEQLRDLPKKQLIEGGYYRVERIHRAAEARRAQTAEPNSASTEDQARPASGCILIAPSWAAHNVLEEHGLELAERLLDAGHEVILRPHPETLKRSPEVVDRFAQQFAENSKLRVERSVGSDDSLLRADILITDWSGIAQEYAFGTERPVLYLDVPRKVHNKGYEDLGIEPFEAQIRDQVGRVLATEEIAEIDTVVAHLMTERDAYRDRIRALRDENIFSFGDSGEVGARHILDVVAKRAGKSAPLSGGAA